MGPAGVLAAHPAFGRLSEPARAQLASRIQERHFLAGARVVQEGDLGDAFFIIAKGVAEVSARSRTGDVPLGRLGPGDDFGEIALLAAEPRRAATVTTATDLVAYELAASDFNAILEREPALRSYFVEAMETHLVARFLKLATPFATVQPNVARSLARKLGRRRVAAGEVIVRQGAPADACFLLREGRAEVVHQSGEHQRVLGTLDPGAFIGEVGVATGAPRNATVRAIVPCTLLVLDREALKLALRESSEFARTFMEFARLRHRPRRASGVTVHPIETPDGEPATVLRHDTMGRYYRLSPRGRYLWDRLDGETTLKDLALAYYREFGEFAPDTIAGILGGLDGAGFLAESAVRRTLVQAAYRETVLDRVLGFAHRLLESRISVGKADALSGWLYGHGGKWLFSGVVTTVLLSSAVVGIAAWVGAIQGATSDFVRTSAAVLLWLIPAQLIATFLHELGHALAVKHAGREVRGAGVGWYWFGPIAFVDTTDMWLAGRRERIVVGLAGPYANLLVATTAAFVAWAAQGTVSIVALQIAALNYVAVVANLNPLLEYDGYHVLVDWFDRPALRRRALAWLGSHFPRALWDSAARKGKTLDLAYGVTAVIYVIGAAVATAWAVRALALPAQETLTRAQANALAGGAALLVVVVSTAGVWNELRGGATTRKI